MSASLNEIARRVTTAGGMPLLVGGCVRDRVLGIECKDIDIEVYGLSVEQILTALSGLRLDVVGAQFGVIKVFMPEQDYDISVPRRENKVGVGHRAFEVEPDPSMSPKEAAARRDFSMNSLASKLDGEILDYYGGLADLNHRILRATSSQFTEDPLRVLRGMQFAARFGMSMEPATAAMCREMATEFGALARERVWGEFEKLLGKGKSIGRGISVLVDTGWLSLFPVLHAMSGCLQDPEWHPEGDALQHTSHVCDAAAEIADRENLPLRERLVLLFAALLHDVGKPSTTVQNELGRWVSPGHAEAGVEPAREFLVSIGAPTWLIEQVLPLVCEHMAHVGIADPNDRTVRRLSLRCSPASIEASGRVVEADHSGRPPLPKGNPAIPFLDIARELAVLASKPKQLLRGRDLIEHLQMPGGPEMGEVLRQAFEVQLDEGWTEVEQAVAWARERFAS